LCFFFSFCVASSPSVFSSSPPVFHTSLTWPVPSRRLVTFCQLPGRPSA
jgi:hypothetical protein